MSNAAQKGFSLAEVLLAIGLLAIALLALIGQSALLAKSNQKTDDSAVALDLANTVLERTARAATMDQPPGTNHEISDWNDPINHFDVGAEKIGFTEYNFEIFITDVPNAMSGAPLGSGASGTESAEVKLKRLQVKVRWWEGEARAEYGELEVETSRLVKVTRVET